MHPSMFAEEIEMNRMRGFVFFVSLALALQGCDLGRLASGAPAGGGTEDEGADRATGVITNGLVGSWNFDSTNYASGGYWYPDGSGKGHDACFVSNWLFPIGWKGTAI